MGKSSEYIEETKDTLTLFKKGPPPIIMTINKKEISIIITTVYGYLEHDWIKTSVVLTKEEAKKVAEKILEFIK